MSDTTNTPRDAAADLAVCAAATPGPWEKMPFGGDYPGVRCIAHPRPDLAEKYPPDQWGAVFREERVCMAYAVAGVNLDFITMARTALPHWIERATAAVAEAERLRAAHLPVGIVMGSESDRPIMTAAIDTLNEFGVPHEVAIVSAHRTPELLRHYAMTAHGRLAAIIAGAGGAAHLPGMLAAQTIVPVFGVPVPTLYLGGVDSLLSIVQMPAGVPVATFGIGGARNAALHVVACLAMRCERLARALTEYRKAMEAKGGAS